MATLTGSPTVTTRLDSGTRPAERLRSAGLTPRPVRGRRRGAIATLARRSAASAAGLFLLLILAMAAGPKFLPYQALPVLSGSMEPTLHVGSLAIVRPVTGDQ